MASYEQGSNHLTRVCHTFIDYHDSMITFTQPNAADHIPWNAYSVMSWPEGIHVAVNRNATMEDPVTRVEYGSNHWYPLRVDLGTLATGQVRDHDFISLCGEHDVEYTLWGKGGLTTAYGSTNATGPVARPDFLLHVHACGGA